MEVGRDCIGQAIRLSALNTVHREKEAVSEAMIKGIRDGEMDGWMGGEIKRETWIGSGPSLAQTQVTIPYLLSVVEASPKADDHAMP